MSRVLHRHFDNHDSDPELDDAGYAGLESSSYAYIQYHLMPVIERVVGELQAETRQSSVLNVDWKANNVNQIITECVLHHL